VSLLSNQLRNSYVAILLLRACIPSRGVYRSVAYQYTSQYTYRDGERKRERVLPVLSHLVSASRHTILTGIAFEKFSSILQLFAGMHSG
jgi:hypothetical protein